MCAVIAVLNAVCWSIVTPPFEVPDEPDHFAYVKQLAETGRLPTSNSEQPTDEEIATLIRLRYYLVRQQPQNHTIATQAEQETLEREGAARRHEVGSPAAGVAAAQPPLYYALEAIPYSIERTGTVLDRLALMRLLSALFAGFTTLFAFMFVREVLPRVPWAWIVGGLSVALVPLLGFVSGAVNPDSLLIAVSSGIFYCLARAFRRGLSTGGAVTIGALMAIGFLTKLNFLGLAPGVLLGLTVLSVRAARVSCRLAYRNLAVAVAIAVSPAVVYAVVNAASHHPVLGLVSGALRGLHGSVLAEANYVWQLYLPRIPGTANDFPGLFPLRQFWFDGYVGLYGWLDTVFPGWVYSLALIPAAAIALLFAWASIQARAALRGRAGELVVYFVMAVGVMGLIGAASYHGFPNVDAEFAEARYLLPLLPLLGAVLALAARAVGRRWGPVVGALVIVLFLAHDVFSQLLVAGRFYG
jgi:4-amino-4-deoxy-L-arabinose transferase-like glycosyltransferase